LDVSHLAPSGLHLIGNYTRDIPVSLNRMMENAYDWEHLPFVHPSSFATIDLIDEGEWGWRCKTTLPPAAGGGEQVVELLVDKSNHYWATTVLEGTGEGVQIHTQATDISAKGDRRIEVDVRFYLPQSPETEEQSAMILGYLQAQYKTLYDEDEALMSARQTALDDRKVATENLPTTVDLGSEAELDRSISHTVILAQGHFTVRFHDGEWIAHVAICPHMLGPLKDAAIDTDGAITCPWHGYRFSLKNGAEAHGRCGALLTPPKLRVENGRLLVGQ
jgi:nitrite reductase/ring-hydroxylating ferredoxin subunit